MRLFPEVCPIKGTSILTLTKCVFRDKRSSKQRTNCFLDIILNDETKQKDDVCHI